MPSHMPYQQTIRFDKCQKKLYKKNRRKLPDFLFFVVFGSHNTYCAK